ncbi:unnamed protein product [marine sediment metagenome]|uniref:Uncharacterized protein n=1 Tax=marine sediment metagenome TaxID=412755 RepID=X0XB43_9ZZZZ
MARPHPLLTLFGASQENVMRFRVLAGKHTARDGRKYGPRQPDGSIVETSANLAKMFPNKFVQVGPDDAPIKPPIEVKPCPCEDKQEPGSEPVSELGSEPKSVRTEKYRLDNLRGGWADVLSVDTGKVINEGALRKKDALQLIDELGGELVEDE